MIRKRQKMKAEEKLKRKNTNNKIKQKHQTKQNKKISKEND